MPPPPICPRCDKSVEAAWWTCPHCEAVLKGPETGSRGGALHGLLERIADLPNNPWMAIPALLGFLIAIGLPYAVVLFAAKWFAWSDAATLIAIVPVPTISLMAAYFCSRQRPYVARRIGGILYGGLALLGLLLISSCAIGGLVLFLTSFLRPR